MNIIKRLREGAGMTQQQLADEMHVDRSAVAKWETGLSLPRIDRLRALAQRLGCTADELLAEIKRRGEA